MLQHTPGLDAEDLVRAKLKRGEKVVLGSGGFSGAVGGGLELSPIVPTKSTTAQGGMQMSWVKENYSGTVGGGGAVGGGVAPSRTPATGTSKGTKDLHTTNTGVGSGREGGSQMDMKGKHAHVAAYRATLLSEVPRRPDAGSSSGAPVESRSRGSVQERNDDPKNSMIPRRDSDEWNEETSYRYAAKGERYAKTATATWDGEHRYAVKGERYGAAAPAQTHVEAEQWDDEHRYAANGERERSYSYGNNYKKGTSKGAASKEGKFAPSSRQSQHEPEPCRTPSTAGTPFGKGASADDYGKAPVAEFLPDTAAQANRPATSSVQHHAKGTTDDVARCSPSTYVRTTTKPVQTYGKGEHRYARTKPVQTYVENEPEPHHNHSTNRPASGEPQPHPGEPKGTASGEPKGTKPTTKEGKLAQVREYQQRLLREHNVIPRRKGSMEMDAPTATGRQQTATGRQQPPSYNEVVQRGLSRGAGPPTNSGGQGRRGYSEEWPSLPLPSRSVWK